MKIRLIWILFFCYLNNFRLLAQHGRIFGSMNQHIYAYDMNNLDSCVPIQIKTKINKPYSGNFLFHCGNDGKLKFLLNDTQLIDENGVKLYSNSSLNSYEYALSQKYLIPFPNQKYSIINPCLNNGVSKLDLFSFEFSQSKIIKDTFIEIFSSTNRIQDMSICRLNENNYLLAVLFFRNVNDYFINLYRVTFNEIKLVNSVDFNCKIDRFQGKYKNLNTNSYGNISHIKLSHTGKYLSVCRHQTIDEYYQSPTGKTLLKSLDNISEVISYELNNISQFIDSQLIFEFNRNNSTLFAATEGDVIHFSPDDSEMYLITEQIKPTKNVVISKFNYQIKLFSEFYSFPDSIPVSYLQMLYFGDLIVATQNRINNELKAWRFAFQNETRRYYPKPFYITSNNSVRDNHLGFTNYKSHEYVLNYLQPKPILTNPCKLQYKFEFNKRLLGRFEKVTILTKPVGAIYYNDSQEIIDNEYYFSAPGNYNYCIRGVNFSNGYSEVYEDTIVVPDPREPDFKNKIHPEIIVASTKDDFNNEIIWNPIKMAHHYRVFRNDEFWKNTSATSILDKFDEPINQAYTYYVIAEDSCEYLTSKSQIVKTIFLSNNNYNSIPKVNDPSSIDLKWNLYEGWADSSARYQLLCQRLDQIWDSTDVTGQTGFFNNNINPDFWNYNQVKYYVKARNKDDVISCSNTINVPLNPIVYVPNTFTPNGDGLNDDFILFLQGWKDLSFQVYNRWGEKVFESLSINSHWHPDNQVASGVYIVKIQGEDLFQRKHYFNQVIHLLK